MASPSCLPFRVFPGQQAIKCDPLIGLTGLANLPGALRGRHIQRIAAPGVAPAFHDLPRVYKPFIPAIAHHAQRAEYFPDVGAPGDRERTALHIVVDQASMIPALENAVPVQKIIKELLAPEMIPIFRQLRKGQQRFGRAAHAALGQAFIGFLVEVA